MKKMLWAVLLLMPLGSWAETEVASMATFFPTPYVAYSRSGGEYLSVGLHQGSGKLSLGYCDADSCLPSTGTSARWPLANGTGKASLTVETGGLNLVFRNKSGSTISAPSKVVISNNFSLGKYTSNIHLKFNNVRVGQICKADSSSSTERTVASMYAYQLKVPGLNLFGYPFPSCKAKVGGTQGTISWQTVKLKDPKVTNPPNVTVLVCGS